MMYLKPLVKKLIKDDLITKQAAEFNNDKKLLEFLTNIVSIGEIEDAFTHHYGMRYIKPNINQIDRNLINTFDINLLEKEVILPYTFDKINNTWYFAISNLTDKEVQKNLTRVVKQNNQLVIFTFAFKHEIEEILSQLSRTENEETNLMLEDTGDFNATEWVETIINKGVRMKASDIHIERQRVGVKVRYRVDGTMTNSQHFDISANEISNIYVILKIVGNMDIVQKRKSQDGRVDNYVLDGKAYDFRVSTINTINGEKFVMRIISKDDSFVSFQDLGFDKTSEEELIKMINKNNGVVYLAGATGAGKTTTLYSMINQLDEDLMNIYTVEKPVEKSIPGINQIQVDEASGVTYPEVLRTLLRQDPDVIIIGEIRDSETAELAVRASLTGHLVMTTVHANNALDSLSRLEDMGVENYLIGASSIGFLSQRLIKLLCPTCKKKVEKLPEYQEIWIKEEMPEFDYETENKKGNYIYEPGDCKACIDGHSGRVAVIEVITVDEKLRNMISKKVGTEEIQKYLKSIGYRNMKQDGINKALSGIISVDQLIGQLQN